MADVEFTKERGKDRKPNMEVNLEEFISIKGINALGNQLTRDKINQINLLDPLPYEAPEEVHADDLEVVDEETVSVDLEVNNTSSKPETSADNTAPKTDEGNDDDLDVDDTGQVTMF